MNVTFIDPPRDNLKLKYVTRKWSLRLHVKIEPIWLVFQKFISIYRSHKSESSLKEIKRTRKAAAFYNYELVGDDFFLNIAHLDCKQKLEHINNKTGFKGIDRLRSVVITHNSHPLLPFILKDVRLNFVACVLLVCPFRVSQIWSKQM